MILTIPALLQYLVGWAGLWTVVHIVICHRHVAILAQAIVNELSQIPKIPTHPTLDANIRGRARVI